MKIIGILESNTTSGNVITELKQEFKIRKDTVLLQRSEIVHDKHEDNEDIIEIMDVIYLGIAGIQDYEEATEKIEYSVVAMCENTDGLYSWFEVNNEHFTLFSYSRYKERCNYLNSEIKPFIQAAKEYQDNFLIDDNHKFIFYKNF